MVKKYKNQDYAKIKAACVVSGALFGDGEFPATNSSLFFSKEPPFKVEWKRPKDITPDPKMFVEGVSSADVTQGKVGNCWFVAAAAALALEKSLWSKVIPDHKSQTFSPEKPEDYQGIFRFHFWRFGEWIEVVVDDRLPTINNELIYVKSKDKNEFWSALLEKAYAKMAGSYEALDAGNPADALVDFTGGVSQTIDLVKENYPNELEKRKLLHAKLQKLMERNSLCSASIKVRNNSEMEQQLDTGLVKGHAYGISNVRTVKLGDGSMFSRFNATNLYLVKLRNPWGQKEWNGAWSDESKEWEKLSRDEREKLDIRVENDGEFWMSFDDFCSHFTNITICVLVNTSFLTIRKTYREGALKGKWLDGLTAGGCINNKATFLQNPQFKFDITGKENDVAFISLMQPDTRQQKAEGKSNLTIGFHVMRVEGNRIYRIHQVYDKAGDSPFVNSREVFVRMELPPGRFLLVPSTFEPNQAGEFLLRVYTDNANYLRELVNDKPRKSLLSSILPCFRYPICQMSCVITTANNLKKNSIVLGVDAYCMIQCEGTKVKTPVFANNCNPVFDYGGLFYIKNTRTAILKIEVWDHHTLLPDTFLGSMERPVEVTNKTLQYTEPLMDRKDKEGRVAKTEGTITYKLTIARDLIFL